MAFPTVFGPLTAATGAELDACLLAAATGGAQICTATGTNAIVLTPAANQAPVTGYGLPNPVKFGFTAAAIVVGMGFQIVFSKKRRAAA